VSGRVARVALQEQLDALEASLQAESDLVLRSLRSALNALEDCDIDLADEVIVFDDEIDRVYVAVQENVVALLARQTPAASDLRLVLATRDFWKRPCR
jgi:phosphate transport system protein